MRSISPFRCACDSRIVLVDEVIQATVKALLQVVGGHVQGRRWKGWRKNAESLSKGGKVQLNGMEF
uniref:Uncharacterized protein n=1 Tax=Arundo donax TaxID=35708 RepID=A0A0A8Z2M2_ARUDO